MLQSFGINFSEAKAKIKGTGETRLIIFVEKVFNIFSSIRTFHEGGRLSYICCKCRFLAELWTLVKRAYNKIVIESKVTNVIITANAWLKRQFHGSAHAHLSKCCSAATWCIVYASKMIVIMMSKNQSVHSPGSHLIKLCENNCKLNNHGIKPSSQQ